MSAIFTQDEVACGVDEGIEEPLGAALDHVLRRGAAHHAKQHGEGPGAGVAAVAATAGAQVSPFIEQWHQRVPSSSPSARVGHVFEDGRLVQEMTPTGPRLTSTAILVGDALQALAFHVLASPGDLGIDAEARLISSITTEWAR